MKQNDARTAIEFEWRDWPEKAPLPTPGDMREFYSWLMRERPHLLDFRTSADRFDLVQRWLVESQARQAVGGGP